MAQEQSGYDAIQPPIPQAPLAKRKIVRGPDGTPQVILVDMAGNTISDPSGYSVYDPGAYGDPNALPGTGIGSPGGSTGKSQDQPSTAQTVIKSTAEGGRDNASGGGGGGGSRAQNNNFGYIDKPGMMGMAGMLPGPAGMVGKAVNAGVNMNNVAAVNAARSSMGLPSLGMGGAVKGAIKDNKGQVADVTMAGSTYSTPVGLEAMSPTGQTNMTPQEAAARARAVGGMTLSTQAEIDSRNAAFNSEFGKPGLLGRVGAIASSFVDNMFGIGSSYNQPNEAISKSIREANSGSNFNPTNDGFSSMLGGKGSGGDRSSGQKGPSYSAGIGKGATSTPGNNVSGASRSTAGKTGASRSPGASAAIGRGQGGLY